MPSNNETTTKFKVDISELKSAMQDAKRQIQVTNSEFKAISSGMDNWAKSTDGISAKLKQLDSNLKSQKSILSSLEKQYELTVAQMGEGSAEADRLKVAINNQKAVINGTERQMRDYENSLEDVAEAEKKAEKHGTSVEEELEDLEKQTKKTGDGFTVFKGVLANLATEGINLVLDGLKNVGSAMVNVVKESVSAYKDYEQLVGGVDTLFKDSSQLVQKYASNAYKTAGMSANEYMETVTSFSASLLQALGGDTKKSAEVADMAITDMSDNANKMGTSMEMIQNAYNGFAKSNFTMLDNLKLGYGGTQEEMKRLLSDAEALTGKKYDISNLNDIFEAIHVIQGELDITGTTAKEASTTIEGSITSMKASWQNLLAGIASGDADIGALTDNLVESVKTVASNLLPVIKTVVTNIISVLKEELPSILNELFEGVKELVSPQVQELMDTIKNGLGWIINNKDAILATLAGIGTAIAGLGIVALVGNFAKVIELVKAWSVVTKLQTAYQTALNIAMSLNPIGIVIALIAGLVTAFVILWNKSETFRQFWIDLWENIKSIVSTVIQALVNFFTVTIPEAVSTFITNVGASIKEFFTVTIPEAIQTAIDWFLDLPYNIGYALGQVIGAVGKWCIDTYTLISTEIPKIIENIVTFFSELPSKIATWFVATIAKVSEWASQMKTKAIETAKSFIENAVTFIKELPANIWTWLTNTLTKVTQWKDDMGKKGKEAIKEFVDKVIEGAKDIPNKMLEIGRNIVDGVWKGIVNAKDTFFNNIKDFFSGLVDGAKESLGIASPSKVFAKEVGRWIPAGIAVGINDNAKTALESMKNLTGSMVLSTRDSSINTGVNGVTGGVTGGVINNFYQTNNSPKALSRLEVYRQSKNLLNYAGGVSYNV